MGRSSMTRLTLLLGLRSLAKVNQPNVAPVPITTPRMESRVDRVDLLRLSNICFIILFVCFRWLLLELDEKMAAVSDGNLSGTLQK